MGRLAFATLQPPDNPYAWSGSIAGIARGLKAAGHEIIWLGPLGATTELLRKFARAKLSRLWGDTVTDHDPLYGWKLSHDFSERLRHLDCDAIIGPAAAIGLSGLKTERPIVYISDATFELMLGYYPEFSRISKLNARTGEAMEQAVMNKARLIILASEWAKQSALQHYHILAERVEVLPFGANITTDPAEAELDFSHGDKLKLLLIGVDWLRKGCDIAVATLIELQKKYPAAELTIIGCTPPAEQADTIASIPGLTIIPRIDKSESEGLLLFNRLLKESRFLLVPTRQEAIGVVFCEASAFAVPSIATDTGGVASHVENGVNGYRLALTASAEQYAELICQLWEDKSRYEKLRRSSRDKYLRELNWTAWGQKCTEFMRNRNII